MPSPIIPNDLVACPNVQSRSAFVEVGLVEERFDVGTEQ